MSDDTTRTSEPQSRFTSDLWRLGFILLLTLAIRTWVVSHAVVTSRDSIGFIRYALQLEDPPMDREHPDHKMTRLEVIQKAEHPPGYYVSVLLVSYPVRAIMGGTTCDSLAMSTQVASVLAALLLTSPMYYLGRLLFDRQTAFVSTLLFQSLPVWTAITSDGLSDGLFLLMGVTTLWLTARAFRQPGFGRFLFAGVGAGFAYLVRPEGVILIGAAGCTAVSCIVFRRWSLRPGMVRISGLVAGGLLVALPYVLLIGKLTNKPTGEGIFNKMIGKPVEPSWKESNVSAKPAASITLFGVWWSEFHNNGQSKFFWAAKQAPLQILKTLHYVLPFLAILGLYLFRRKIWEDSAALYLAIQLAAYFAALVTLGIVAGYISERHTLLVSLIGCYFAVATFPKCGEWMAQIGPIGKIWSPQTLSAGLAFWLLVGSLPADFKKLHANRAGHRAAGEWLAQHIQPDEDIFDIFAWAVFYSGRDLNIAHDNFAFSRDKKKLYVIVEPRLPHSKITNINEAKDLASRGEKVYWWPEGDFDKASVIVYRWDPHWNERD